jgi:hypothetical protein
MARRVLVLPLEDSALIETVQDPEVATEFDALGRDPRPI